MDSTVKPTSTEPQKAAAPTNEASPHDGVLKPPVHSSSHSLNLDEAPKPGQVQHDSFGPEPSPALYIEDAHPPLAEAKRGTGATSSKGDAPSSSRMTGAKGKDSLELPPVSMYEYIVPTWLTWTRVRVLGEEDFQRPP